MYGHLLEQTKFGLIEHHLSSLPIIPSGEEGRGALEEYERKPYQLLNIKAFDTDARAIKAKAGYTAKIIGKTVTACEAIVYRYRIEGSHVCSLEV